MDKKLMRCVVPAVVLGAIISACDDSPTVPNRSPSAVTAPVPSRIDIGGPRSVPPGATSRLTATAQFGDGSTRDVTNQANWRSADPSVLSFPQPGLALGHRPGDSVISAGFNFAVGTREVIVTPAGTFRLTGRVSEAGSPNAAVAEATVAMTTGSSGGPAAITEADGRYRLYGVPGAAEIRVTKDGYRPHTENVVLGDHDMRDFELDLVRPRPNFAGTYTLTIAAASACAAQLPEPARTRRYTAVLTQTGPAVEAALSGASFVLLRTGQGSRLRGSIEESGVTFKLTEYDWYYKGYGQPYADLVEMIEPTVFLVVDGIASAAVSGKGLSGRLRGSFQVFGGDPRWAPARVSRCLADDHDFVLSR